MDGRTVPRSVAMDKFCWDAVGVGVGNVLRKNEITRTTTTGNKTKTKPTRHKMLNQH